MNYCHFCEGICVGMSVELVHKKGKHKGDRVRACRDCYGRFMAMGKFLEETEKKGKKNA